MKPTFRSIHNKLLPRGFNFDLFAVSLASGNCLGWLIKLLEISVADRRTFTLFSTGASVGNKMWWAWLCLFGITLTTSLEHRWDDENDMPLPDKRIWKISFNLLQRSK